MTETGASLKSRPTFCSFSPDVIPYQRQAINLLRSWDYAESTPEILLSGSFGSAKSTLMAHITVRHCIEHKGSRVALGRRALPDLKRTIWNEILEHMSEDFVEGVHYELNRSLPMIRFKNGSEIICTSWADKRYSKFRSLKLSGVVFEEIVENDDEDSEAFRQLKARLRRLPHVKQNFLIAATNPSSPESWVYKYFIEGADKYKSRHVFYSRTEDNPFIDQAYIRQLRQDLSRKEAQRYLDGLWVEIRGEVVYFDYDRARNFAADRDYTPDKAYPIIISFDFNIGQGKPMSCCLLQYVNGHFHVFDEVVIDGANTGQVMDELESRGLLSKEFSYWVCGDAAGKNRDTRSSRSDYEIITGFLERLGLAWTFCVPAANPPIRTRHNRVNSYCINAAGEVRLTVYRKAATVDEGLRLVKLKDTGNYIEDDSKRHQHVCCALGYSICYIALKESRRPQATVKL